MANEGYKKKDIQRAVQKVHIGTSANSSTLSAAGSEHIEIGFPAEKMTLVTTGSLACSVQPKIGNANSNTAVNATTTPSTTTTTNMFSSVVVTWTSGSGQLLILAK